MRLLILSITLLFSTPAWAANNWERVARHGNGNIVYVDFDNMRQNDGYIYFWSLTDYIEPEPYDDDGVMSHKTYFKVDCDLRRHKVLKTIWFLQPMGFEQHGKSSAGFDRWLKFPPNSIGAERERLVCERASSGQ